MRDFLCSLFCALKYNLYICRNKIENMKKESINMYIEMHLGDVELNILVTKDLKKQDGVLFNFGHIEVNSGHINGNNCFWDNLNFFLSASFSDFKEECAEELKSKGFPVKETYKNLKRLLKRAKKLNLLTI